MKIFDKINMYLFAFSTFLFSNLAWADVDTAPTKVSDFAAYLTAVGTSMTGLQVAVVTIMGIIILVMGIISLGGIVAGLLKKMFG